MDGDLAAPVVHDAEVANAARRATRDPAAEVLEWAVTAIPHVGIIDTTGGLHLVVARVRSRDAEVSLSLVLKVLTRPPDDECHSPGSWCYWRREAEFYGSDLATGPAGPLRAPRPYGVVDRDGEAHVWMEQVAAAAARWEPEDFRRAARAAGVSAAPYLTGRPLPDEPWLAHGFLRSILGDGGFWATTMQPDNDALWRSGLVEAFGPAARERVQGLWAERDALLAIAEALPRVFGHGDFHPRNVLLPAGVDDVVALDWGFCGPAPLGADLADLVHLPAWFCDIEVADIPAVEHAAFAGYDAGLRETGWGGDPRLVRLGYALASALRMGACMPGWAWLMLGPQRPSSERLFGRPADAILSAWIALAEVYLDRADEARALARELGVAPP